MSDPRPPTATYRLQLTPEVGFDAAAGLVDHLAAVGVSHLYLSPIAEATPGSTHGYDVTDHARVRAELGGPEALSRLVDRLVDAGMGLMLDIVPNHASVAEPRRNRRWWNLLAHGPDHPDAACFDVDWDAGDGRVLLPVLDGTLAGALAAGDLAVVASDDGPVLTHRGTELPLAAGTADLDLPELVEAQHYRLIDWRSRRRNVRRFFTIDDLVALRADRPEVAADVHAPLVDLRRRVTDLAVRVDHVDGLARPGEYLRRLRDAVPDAWVVVEKILAPDERLPSWWPVQGTTGYDFARLVDQVLVDPTGAGPLTDLWQQVTGDRRDFLEHRRVARREVLEGELAPDLARVTATLAPLVHRPPEEVAAAVAELLVEADRYRTYLPDDPEAPDLLDAAAERVGRRRPELTDAARGVLAVLVGAEAGGFGRPVAEACSRFQQLSAPVVAKGDEDRAFYRYHRLSALCEVGGTPEVFGLGVDDFHDDARWRAEHRPLGLLAGTTHDTKRSEGVRARLLVLSEVPEAWRALVEVLEERAASEPTMAGVAPADRYLALQTAVGAWPIDADRLGDFLVKAAREADQHTSWVDGDPAYEDRLRALARLLVEDERWAGPIAGFVDVVARPGWSNALAGLVLRATAPGVPDVYQGCERWNPVLVDPDNRLPPDWAALADQVEKAATANVADAWREPTDGLVKTTVLLRLLDLRGRRPAAFAPGSDHVPLRPSGTRDDHLVAYVRGHDVLVAVTRLPLGVADGWHGTTLDLPEGRWRSALHPDHDLVAGTVEVADLLAAAPVAVLERVADPVA